MRIGAFFFFNVQTSRSSFLPSFLPSFLLSFLSSLGLRYCAWAFSSCSEQGKSTLSFLSLKISY